MDTRSKNIIKLLIIGALFVSIIGYFFYSRGTRRGVAGISDPVQTEDVGNEQITVSGYNVLINYEYAYDISALVVSTHDYYGLGLGNKLAPRDFALAWGPVAEYNDRIDFNWGQSGRWYHWRCKSYEDIIPVGGEAGVNTCSANNHIMPANNSVRRKIKKVRRGDYIRIKGHLANVYASNSKGDSFQWNSSTSREDTGDGACELIYVTDIQWLD